MVILHVEANTPSLKSDLNNILCSEGFTPHFKEMCSQDPKIVFSTVFYFKNYQKRKPVQVFFNVL
jgi:hypothetical protein